MSGWQRIGVVISVIWLVAVPIYLMVSQNNQASELYGDCFSSAYRDFGPGGYESNSTKFDAAKQRCTEVHDRIAMPPDRLLRFLRGEDKESWLIWAMMLAPLAAFWAISSIIFSTVRWIRRGFAEAKET